MLTAIGVLAATVLVHALPERDKNGLPHLRSESVIVRLTDTNEIVLKKKPDEVRPIASVTKLLSTLVMARRRLEPPAEVTLEEADKDRLKWSRSRLAIGATYAGGDLYRAALIASDNRAIYALVRTAGLERAEFVAEMNALAAELGMTRSQFRDPAGIDPANVSTASDLLLLLDAVAREDAIASTTRQASVELVASDRRTLRLGNTNRLVHSPRWHVVLGKTGYTVEAGRSLVLRVELAGRPVDMVFLGSREMASIFGDAARVRRWLEEKIGATASLREPASSAMLSAP